MSEDDTSGAGPAREPAGEERRLRAALPPEIDHRVRSARILNGRAIVVAEAGDLSPAKREELEAEIARLLSPLAGVEEVRVALTGERRRRRIIAVGSGKGGVGKSTLTANLAVALARLGRRVGVIDGDIYGPSQPKLLATEGTKPTVEDEKLVPLDSPHGVKVLSMGHLVAPGKALAWRGPMAGKALGQLVEANWGETELLLIDMPPGTGDVQLSMMADHKPDGVVLVSTPQDLALIDAARAGQLFDQGEVAIIGLVENMAGEIFGSGGVEKFAHALDIPFLGRIPLDADTRVSGDAGHPPAAGDGEAGKPFRAIGEKLARWLDTGKV
ncbi:P-loop NTPase [Erythrobacter sp. HL-111]|uniref:P-loop NTPase n=1 Tax=Erythrobacter sp. HL-111 TaxID=1798193 RepID=UPI0006D94C3D|nr:P-loop NTPase [Erythrobacter sp. HL-111]KPP87373.1 MAG: ATP-binding protein involved in chromosome partitioning [Erythrobacteraceae bacterium HL-111]SDS97535.1 ATP-binding protein involved in chromosome partitioning [Erythrobacter sp. HL-111]